MAATRKRPTVGQIPSVGVIPPNHTHSALVRFEGPVTRERVEGLKTRKLLLYLFGEVSYKDIFGKPHETQFCGIYNPATDTRFDICEQHNRAN